MVNLKDLKSHKACTKCRKVKHVREFPHRGKAKSGLGSWCIGCSTNASRECEGRWTNPLHDAGRPKRIRS